MRGWDARARVSGNAGWGEPMDEANENALPGDGPWKKRRAARRVTEDSLRRSGLHYLQRFAASTQSLRRVLERRVLKSAAVHDIDVETAAGWIDSIIERFTRAGLLDDGGFAEMRARSLFQRGMSTRMIRVKLVEKGLARADIEQALASLFAGHPTPDRVAAGRFAQRRRLGPYRVNGERATNRARDLAALARAGFSYDVARTVIDAESIDDPEIEPLDIDGSPTGAK